MQSLKSATTMAVPASECARKIIDTVPLVVQFMRREMRMASSAKLSIPQLRTLNFISIHDHPSLSAAADFIGLSLPAMSRLVDALVRAGLVTRTACQNDRRHVRLGVTGDGQSALDESWKSTHARIAEEVTAMTPVERATVSAAMDVLRASFDPEVSESRRMKSAE